MNQSPSSSSSSSVASSWYMVSLCNFKSICQIPPWIAMETKLKEQKSSTDIMTFSFNDDDAIDLYSTPATTASMTIHSDSAAIAENIPMATSEEEEEDDEGQSIRSNKSFKRTLKSHFQMIRQKQQSLNEIMKRSILRKSSKSSLLQSSNYDTNSTIIMKPSISTSSTASTASSSSSLSSISTSPPSPIVFLSSSLTSLASQDQVHSDKARPVHPLALERRSSISDSLLKSINKKKKQPATFTTNVTTSSNQYNNYHLNIDARKETSPYLDPSSSHLYKPSLPTRRKTSPEFPSLSKK